MSHIGIIESLIAAKVEPDIVCGTSIGALVGAAYCAGRLSELRRWAETVTWQDVVGLMDVRLLHGGLLDGRLVVEFLGKLGIGGSIEGIAKPFAAVATDLSSGREVWLRSGPILKAVRASISMPGILSPVEIDGKWLVDGAVTNPVPVSLCRALGADVIIAVNLNGDLIGRRPVDADDEAKKGSSALDPAEFLDKMLKQLPPTIRSQVAQIAPRLLPQGSSAPGYFEVLTHSLHIMQDQITRTRLAGEPAHVMLVPRLPGVGAMDFHRAKEAMDEGRACLEHALPLLRRYV
jgi:NTE family protein